MKGPIKIMIGILFRKIRVPVEWVHETVDTLDSSKDGEISLGELAIALRQMWKAMRKARKLTKV